MIYQLSDEGRMLTWDEWEKAGGCGLPHIDRAKAIEVLGPMSRWRGVRLGHIEDAWPPAGRTLARFAADHLKRLEWAREVSQV